MNNTRNLQPGDIVQHFKRELVEDQTSKEYLYQIIAFAKHSETREDMVVYKAFYGECGIWVRPYEMFMEKVDRDKYPEIKQTYRFEKVREDITE